MKFSDIPGQDEIKKRLIELADSERIPHALLLEGPAGIGKHALARAFLQYVGCRNRHDGDSCGVCPSCIQHAAMQHIDTIFSFPYVKRSGNKDTLSGEYLPDFISYVKEYPFMDSAVWVEKYLSSNTKPMIYVEEASELIRRLSFAPHVSRYTSVILWQADRMNEAAANKLLKIIEEPPGDSIIVMTSDAPMNILPTIYSRVQRIKVLRLSDNDVARWLVTQCGVEPEKAADVAPLAQGSLSEARRIAASTDDSVRFLEYFIALMRLAYMRDILALKDWAQKVATERRETLVAFLQYVGRMIRENFIANLKDASLNLMSSAESDFSRNFAKFINERNVEDLFDATSEAIQDIRSNVNAKLVLFDFAITVILKLKN